MRDLRATFTRYPTIIVEPETRRCRGDVEANPRASRRFHRATSLPGIMRDLRATFTRYPTIIVEPETRRCRGDVEANPRASRRFHRATSLPGIMRDLRATFTRYPTIIVEPETRRCRGDVEANPRASRRFHRATSLRMQRLYKCNVSTNATSLLRTFFHCPLSIIHYPLFIVHCHFPERSGGGHRCPPPGKKRMRDARYQSGL
jgi:hypothetical protein